MELAIAVNRAAKARKMLDEYRAEQMNPRADEYHIRVGIGHWREVLDEAEAVKRQHGEQA